MKSFILFSFICGLFFHLELHAQEAGAPHNEKCSDREVLKEMSDRLLVHYYCTTTLNPTKMEKETGYVDDNGLPKMCNVAIRNLEAGFPMRSYLISEISRHDRSLRQDYERRIRNNNALRILDFVLSSFGWPNGDRERGKLAQSYARTMRNEMLGVEIKTPKLFKEVRKVGNHIDLLLALSSLNSDLTNGCGIPSITNMEIVNGSCRKIIAYTPRFVEILKQSHENQYLEIRTGLNCGTFWDIYEGYLAPANGESAVLATPATRTQVPADADDED